MLDSLGTLQRTHYCGNLRAADADKDVVLMGWVHKRRDLGNLIFIDLRDRSGLAQIVFNKELHAAAHGRAEELRSEFVVAVSRARGEAAESESRSHFGRSGNHRQRVAHPEHGQDAALRGRRRTDRERRDPPALPLPRFAAHETSAEPGAAPPRDPRNPQGHGRDGLLRNRNAHAHALDARRRARLSGAQPRASRGSFTRCRNRRRFSSRS